MRQPLACCLAMTTLLAACVNEPGPEPLDSDHCPALEPVECALSMEGALPLRAEGTTAGRDDRYGGSACGIGGGVAVEDVAFRFTAGRAGTYRFNTEGSSFNTVLSVRPGSCGGRETRCNDDAYEGVQHSSVTLELDECETVTLVIDGYDLDGVGDYVFTVDASETACTDGVDDDGDGLTDCDDPDCFGPRCDIDRGDWPEDWAGLERGILDAVNAQRAAGAVCDGETMPPVGQLAHDVFLEAAARAHSLDMAEQGYFSHTSLDGREPEDRAQDVGFPNPFVGENIAAQSETVAEVMASWMSSPGHCRNIMEASYTVLGVGYANPPGTSGPFWTQNFGQL